MGRFQNRSNIIISNVLKHMGLINNSTKMAAESALSDKHTIGKTWLNEVSFMRPILLVLLVSYHAFAPYVGTWPLPEGIHQVESYGWIGLLSRAFRLEGFVFISGYIFTFQLVEKKKFSSFKSLFVSKFQRLLIPGFIFSALYVAFFLHDLSPVSVLLKVVEGAGHLWYLPCLFWCFLLQYLIISRDVNRKLMTVIILVAGALSCLPLPFQMGKACYYIMFFCGGGVFWKYRNWFHGKGSVHNILISWIIFTMLFVTVNLIIERLTAILSSQECSIALKGCILLARVYMKAILGWSGIVALYLTSVYYCNRHTLGKTVLKIGVCGYGVYVFHQFILVYLYRHTELPSVCGTYRLPWTGFLITTVLSVSLTLLVRQTKIGRKYL